MVLPCHRTDEPQNSFLGLYRFTSLRLNRSRGGRGDIDSGKTAEAFVPTARVPEVGSATLEVEDKHVQSNADIEKAQQDRASAIATKAEMMWKYLSNDDVIQRTHVTGRTNGIQAGTKMGYTYQPGLLMRNDKEAFAMEAMEAASIVCWHRGEYDKSVDSARFFLDAQIQTEQRAH